MSAPNSKWPILEQVAPVVKDSLIEIEKHLEKMLKAKDVLLTLYHNAVECEHETITLANETVFTLGCMIDANVDAVFYHLNEIFKPVAQAETEGGAA